MATSHEETIKTKLYQNWIKSGLGLKYLKEGLQPFVKQVIKDQHKRFVEKLQPCGFCSLGTLLPNHALWVGRNCSLGCEKCLCIGSKHTVRIPCPSKVCGKIYDKIVTSHVFADPNYSNTDVTKWVEDPWELAKCYINAWGYKDKISAEDTDCLGILSIVINDTEFYSLVDPATVDICKKVRTYRNDIMHSSSLEVEDDNLKTYIEDMIAILKDPNQLKDEEYAESARTQLQKLLDQEIHISTSDEILVIHEAQRVQASRIDDFIQDLDQMKKENRELFDCINKVQDCLRKSMDNDQQKFAADIEQVKKDVESLKTELKDNCLQKIQDILQRLEREKLKKAEDKLKRQFLFDKLKKPLKYLKDKNRLREKLFEMYEKHLSTMPISPVLEEVCAHVGDIYVDLVICDHLLKVQHDKRTQKKVERYKDIFFRNDKQCFDIYMLGDAGMGKTTWCVKLINEWVKVLKNKLDVTRNNCDLQCFDVVILVFLRNATEEVNILDMIKEQLFSENIAYYEILTKILRKEPHKCLIIADGLDEWKMLNKQVSKSCTQNQNIPGKVGLNGCPLLITSRISAIYDLRLKENEFDRCVKIEGIRESDKLAAKIINELNKLSDGKMKKQFKDFHETLEQIRLKPFFASLPFADKTPISECMNVPLLLVMSVCIWFQYGKIEPTLAGIYCEMFKYLFDYACSMKTFEFTWPMQTSSARTEDPWRPKLPKELKDRIPRQCVDLILKMSKFAFDRLFEDCDESPQKLVFNEEVLGKWFSSSDLQAAIKSGILSKSVHVNQPLKRTASMSFLHKSFQEFLSAVHIVSQFQNVNIGPLEVFQKYCCNYEKLIEMENVLLFVCGFEPRAASQMSLHVQTIAKEMLKTETKFTERGTSDYLIKNLPLKCTIQVHENNKDYPSAVYPIHIETLSLSLNDIVQHCLAGNMEYIYYMFISNISKILTINVHLGDRWGVVSQRRPLIVVGGLKVPQPYVVSPLFQHCQLPFSLKECVLEYIDLSQFSAQQILAFGKSLKQLTQLKFLKLNKVNCSSSMKLYLQNCRLRSLEVKDTNIEVKANVQGLETLVLGNSSVKLFKEFKCGHDNQILRIHRSSPAEFDPDIINQILTVFRLTPETKLKVENTLFENKFVSKNTNISKIDRGNNFRSYIHYDSKRQKYAVMYKHENMQTNEMEQFLSFLDIYSNYNVQSVYFVFKDLNVNVHEKTLTDFLRKCEISEVELKRSTSRQMSDGRKCIQLSNSHLTITNNSVLKTPNIIKYVFSTECIKNLRFSINIIEHPFLDFLVSTQHFTELEIIFSREQNSYSAGKEVLNIQQQHWKNMELRDNYTKIFLHKEYKKFKACKKITCLNTTMQETLHCTKLAVSNHDIKSVQIKIDFIDDETIASLIECKHLKTVRIEVLLGEVPLVKVIQTMISAQTLSRDQFRRLKYEIMSNRVRLIVRSREDNRIYDNAGDLHWSRNRDRDRVFMISCSKTNKEETRNIGKLVISNKAISSVHIKTESIDDKTFAGLIACDHLVDMRLNIEKVEPIQFKKLSKLMKDSKFQKFYDSSSGSWTIAINQHNINMANIVYGWSYNSMFLSDA